MFSPKVSGFELITAIDKKIEKIRSRKLDLSFNELLDMYRDNELIIDPEYQRLFRWSQGTQSRFIESLILEMPISPIYVIELSEGTYELIDGLQRLSSYFHFRGEHPERLNPDGTHSKLTLSGCDISSELNGHTFDSLPAVLQIRLKRNFIRVEILKRESDQRSRYYVFKRLNTGGEIVSNQEIRNCTIRLLDNRFNQFIINLADNSDFKECISTLPKEKIERKEDHELVLRFFAFKNSRQNLIHDVSDFLTEYMESVSDPTGKVPFNYFDEQQIFEKTFNILNRTLGSSAFAGTNPQSNLITNFLSHHYEAFTLGLQPYLSSIDPSNEEIIQKLREIFLSIKKDQKFLALTTRFSGVVQSAIDKDAISFVEKRIEEIF
jgi:hypothetical protein